MAHPSSSHRDADTTTHRAHRTSSSQHHHHRTISSTTLLLVLSLILAVLAVMLSLPSRHSASSAAAAAASHLPHVHGMASGNADHEGTSAGFWGYLTPKRSHALVSRESNVAMREAEVARREAELLIAAPGGIQMSCPPCQQTVVEEYVQEPAMTLVSRPQPPPVVVAPPPAVTIAAPPPTTTIVQEVVKTVEVTPSPEWLNARVQEILDREMKIADREKDVGKREETLGRRESDTTKREGWVMEQIVNLQPEVETEEYVYEAEPPRHLYGEARRPPPKVGGTATRY